MYCIRMRPPSLQVQGCTGQSPAHCSPLRLLARAVCYGAWQTVQVSYAAAPEHVCQAVVLLLCAFWHADHHIYACLLLARLAWRTGLHSLISTPEPWQRDKWLGSRPVVVQRHSTAPIHASYVACKAVIQLHNSGLHVATTSCS